MAAPPIPRPWNPFIDDRQPGMPSAAPGMIRSAMTPDEFDQRFNPPPAQVAAGAPGTPRMVPRIPSVPDAPLEAPTAVGAQTPGKRAGGGLFGDDTMLALAAGILEGGTDGEAIGRGFNYALQNRAATRKASKTADEDAGKSAATVDYLTKVGAEPGLIDMAKKGYGGDALSLYKSGLTAKGQKIDINMPGENTSKLRENLDKTEGEKLAAYRDQGDKAITIQGDMQALNELSAFAPQGAIQGRLASLFPGFSVAGDAFNSIVYKLAPSLRTPGSGSTSDIEYDGFLRAIPNLRNTPEANQIIMRILNNKAKIDIERAQAVEDYQNGDIDAKQMRLKIRDAGKKSIMDDEARGILNKSYGGDGYDRASEYGKKSPSLVGGTSSTGVEFQVK